MKSRSLWISAILFLGVFTKRLRRLPCIAGTYKNSTDRTLNLRAILFIFLFTEIGPFLSVSRGADSTTNSDKRELQFLWTLISQGLSTVVVFY